MPHPLFENMHPPVSAMPGDSEAPRQIMLLDALASDLMSKFDAAQRARRVRDESMLRSLQQVRAQYDEAMQAMLNRTTLAKTYFPAVDLKRATAFARLAQVFCGGTVPPFGMGATEDPVLPVNVGAMIRERIGPRAMAVVQQSQGQVLMDEAMMSWLREAVYLDVQNEIRREAEARAKRNERTIKDAMEEGGTIQALKASLDDGVTFDGGFLRVVPRMKPRMTYDETGPIVEERVVETVEAVHPLHVYPQPGIERIDEGYIFLWRRRNRAEMNEFFGVPGVRGDKLTRILARGGVERSSGEEEALERRKEVLERKSSEVEMAQVDDSWVVLNYYGTLRGRDLKQWGWEDVYGPASFGDEDAVECQAWLVDNEVIKVALNEHPLRLKPVFKWGFREVPHAFWSRGVPEILRPIEGAFLASIRLLQNNLAIGSGPQVVVNTASVRNDLDPSKMRPWMIWETTQDPYGQQRPVVDFYQPDTRAHELMAAATFFDNFMDVMVGIPSFYGGDVDVKGAGRTSSGLHQIRQEAGALLQHSAASVDEMIRQLAVWFFTTMLSEGRIRPEDQGDARITVFGTAKLAEMEQNAHNIVQFLQVTANPIDLEVLGIEGRRSLLIEAGKSLKLNFESLIVPGKAAVNIGYGLGAAPVGPGGGPPQVGGGGQGEAPQSQPAGGPPPGGQQG